MNNNLEFLDTKNLKLVPSKNKKFLLVIMEDGKCITISVKFLQKKLNQITNSAIYQLNKSNEAS